MNEIGLAIRRAREIARWTQDRLAIEIETTQARVSCWESGRSIPSLDHLIAITIAMGRDLEIVFNNVRLIILRSDK